MLTIESNKKICNKGEIIEITPFLAQRFFAYNIKLEDFKKDSRFFMIMYDIRKSSKILYYFELVQLKDFMNKKISKRLFKFCNFCREDLIILNNHLIKKLDKSEIALLYLSSSIELRRNYD